MHLFRKAIVLAAAASLLFAACGDDDDDNATDTSAAKGSLTIGSANFSESELVADIYAAALRAKGYTVTVRAKLGTREITQPALEKGELDVMPEYIGTLLTFLKGSPSGDLTATTTAARAILEPKGLSLLDPAPAYDRNALVVTKATADKHNLTKTSDLASVASQLSLGGPPECPTRPLCLIGFKDKYGLNFKTFKPLDAGGPLTKKALTDGDIDVALLFSSDIPANTVVLEDDKALQPVDNVIPEIRTSKATAEVKEILNGISKKLTLDELVELNQKIAGPDKPDIATVANDWVKEYG